MKKMEQNDMANISGGLKCIYESLLFFVGLSGMGAAYNCVIKDKDHGY
ncbi:MULTISPECIES: hypothetical protein [Chryseobacterium]|nr:MULTISPECIES: hypothetical protein [Chryseobacterium]MDQ8143451.1 hypothetical protein [Chryseobacterium sp. CFS15]